MLGKHKDAAILWIDAHPDVHLPGDSYTGYHAMVLGSALGKGDPDFQKILPGVGTPQRTMLVGLRNLDNTGSRVKDWGIHVQGTAHGEDFIEPVLKWLESIKPSMVLVHFDLDVLDPAEFRTAVGADPDGLFIKDVVELLQEINIDYPIGALTVAEFMPTWAIRIRSLFQSLPLSSL